MEVLARSRILVVDDDPAVRGMLATAFDDRSHEIEAVDCGLKALKALRERPFDFAIVDKSLPGMDGVELIRHVHGLYPDVWSAVITAYPTPESAMELLHLGVRCYIEKPFDDIQAVVQRIDQMLELRRSRRLLQGAISRLRGTIRTLSRTQALNILVVAPSPEERAWLVRHSGDERDVVRAVAWPGHALQEAREGPPDLIVLDVPLPRADLVALIREARTVAPLASLVVVCDAPSMPLLVDLIDVRAAAVIEHPLAEGPYRARMNAVLDGLRRTRAFGDAGVHYP